MRVSHGLTSALAFVWVSSVYATTVINDFNDLNIGDTVTRDRYLSQGLQIEIGPSGTSQAKIKAALNPCEFTAALTRQPFDGPSYLFRFPDGVSMVRIEAGDGANSDSDNITMTAFGDDALTVVVSTATAFIAQGTPTSECVPLTVTATVIKAVEITSQSFYNGEPHPNSILVDNLVYDTLPFEIKLEKVGTTSIDPVHNYSENSVIKATVIYPAGSSRAGSTVTSFTGPITFTEDTGTTYYNGANGASALPMTAGAAGGIAQITVRSVSNSVNLQGPPEAQVIGSSPGLVSSASTNPLIVDQWVDEGQDGMVDWLSARSNAILNCEKALPGEAGTVASKVSVVQPEVTPGLCGATEMWLARNGPVRVSTVCTGGTGTNLHRTNTNMELSDTMSHESRHAWQNSDRAANLGTNDDGNPSTPKNDDDLDLFVELVSFPSANALKESVSGSGDLTVDPGGETRRHDDAVAFAQANKNSCP